MLGAWCLVLACLKKEDKKRPGGRGKDGVVLAAVHPLVGVFETCGHVVERQGN